MRQFNRTLLTVLLGSLLGNAALAQDWATKMFEITQHDFGAIAANGKAEFEFKMKNPYREEIRIADVRSSCGCTRPRIATPLVKSGEEGTIVAAINTQAFRGHRGATLTVTIDRPALAQVQLRVSCHILDVVTVYPDSVQFGTVDQGVQVERELEIRYARTSGLEIRELRRQDPHLAIEVIGSRYEGNDAVHRVRVRLAQDAPAGEIRDRLLLITNDPTRSQIPVPIEGRVVSGIVAGPAELFLGVVQPGEKVSKPVVVRGKTAFRITDVSSQDRRFRFDLADRDTARKVHVIPVTFVAGSEPGKVTQTIHIRTDLNNGSADLQANAIVSSKRGDDDSRTQSGTSF